jgi:hypothetical protein
MPIYAFSLESVFRMSRSQSPSVPLSKTLRDAYIMHGADRSGSPHTVGRGRVQNAQTRSRKVKRCEDKLSNVGFDDFALTGEPLQLVCIALPEIFFLFCVARHVVWIISAAQHKA